MNKLNPLSNQNNTSPSKKCTTRDVIGSTVGSAIGLAPMALVAKDALTPPKKEAIPELQAFMDLMMPPIDSFENTKATAEKVLQKTGLDKKGVEIFIADGSPSSRKELDKLLEGEKPKKMVESFKEMVHSGVNAFFYPKKNKILINDKHATSSVFHEIGHAQNSNDKNILVKALKKGRMLTPMNVSLVAPVALGIAMLHKEDKNKPKENKDITEKSLDFVSNNAGKLTLASYIPVVGEEALASIRGIKAAKEFLNPEQVSSLTKSYAKAGSTYAVAALLISGGVGLASIVKNQITKTKEA